VKSRLFPALLKFHRGRRGLSQLELALEAGVSARHVSFLESGRAQPSAEMVLRLLSVLGVSLREQNEALGAAGLAPRFPEPTASSLAPEVDAAISQMMRQHEPFPLTVLDIDASVLRANRGAQALFQAFAAEPQALGAPPDLFSLFFDPRLWRPFVVDWEHVARAMLARLHRDCLLRGDARLSARLEQLLAYPGVPASFRQVDFAMTVGPTATFRLERDALAVGFLVTVTTFSGPCDVTLEELRIESCFPLDAPTRAICERLTARV
jgi:transcriptional regulator with XRE-family HTH domain